MAKGQSGRVVLELEPSLKRQLYSALTLKDSTLKNWLIVRIENYLENFESKADMSR